MLTITGTATDSRGFSTTASKTVTVLAYNTPSVVRNGNTGRFVCARSTSDGTINEDGTALYVECSKSFSSLAGNNKCTLRLRYAAEGGGWSSWITLLAESSGNDYAGVVPGVTLSVSVVYTIEIQAVDKLGESGSVETRIPTSEMTFHLGENGKAVGIGRYASESGEKRLDVAWDAHFEKGLQVGGTTTLGGDLTGKYLTGTWLRTTEATDLGKTPPKVAVLDNAGWVYSRTPAELRADLGYGDYVLEQGTSGIWTYRKWASGVAECWGQPSKSVASSGTFLGAYAFSTYFSLPAGIFTSVTEANVNPKVGNGYAIPAYINATNASIGVDALANNSGTQTFSAHISVKGKWK